MAKTFKNIAAFRTRVLDSDTRKECLTEKVVDVTEDCPGANEKEPCILVFFRAKRGLYVEITRPWEGEMYVGMHNHFLLSDLADTDKFASDDLFGACAEELGLNKLSLRALIETHMAPA
ncbi:MAG: hypothetical protein ABII13_03420 [Patescibacteria group bacterium]|nr:hypothetical protein [Patescibacteria group bacterium]MBU2509250.1 hypothetical protein [Patescibacteria group bacterium]